MKKKYYLEAVRIAAILMVMYNHSPAFLSFANQSGAEYAVSFFFSMVAKAAVPLFFMVSGVLLLGKKESGKALFQKRILRMILVIVVFSALYYLKLVLKGEQAFAPLSFLRMLPQDVIFLPYWYLYSYLGMLTILPILRPLAQNLPTGGFLYLLALQLIFDAGQTTSGYLFGYSLCGYYGFKGLFQQVIFYPLIGYGLDRWLTERAQEERFFGMKNILRNLAVIAAALLTQRMVYRNFLEVGNYQEMYLGVWVAVPAAVLFVDAALLFREDRISERCKKEVSYVGGCVFGIYLLDGFIGTGGALDVVFRVLSPIVGFLPAYLIEILIAFAMRLCITAVLKKLPGFRKIL